MLFEPASAETQHRLRRVASKLLGEEVHYHTEYRGLGVAGATVRSVGLGEILSVTDQHIIFTGVHGEEVIGLGNLRSLDIDAGAGP